MLPYPQIDPVLLQIGPLKVHWYGVMYLLGFGFAWWLGVIRAKREDSPFKPQHISDMVFYGALGAVLGGRIGYVLFYKFNEYLHDPLAIFAVWQGGMSFHGGLLGVLIAMYLIGRQHKLHFFTVTDFIAPLIPLGLFFGRIGNFINGELWGRTTELPWGIVFPYAGDLPRHPSQLYEAFLEGLVMFAVLWWFSSKARPRMAVSGLFLILYGSFRFLVEFAREPDAHLGLLYLGLSMGQWLSLPMALIGFAFMLWAYRVNQPSVSPSKK
jgi:phosphatidylglycerol:prolipoprotein diacylglycerol transferase